MMRYEEPSMDMILLQMAGDVITLSLGDNDPGEGDDYWGTKQVNDQGVHFEYDARPTFVLLAKPFVLC